MGKLLYIQASPRGERSKSIAVANAFIQSYKEKNPSDAVEVFNIFEENLVDFGVVAANAKYTVMHGKSHSQEELAIWKEVEKTIEHFKSADKYVIAVAMWNFSIPWRLKQYIDIIVQPGYTFGIDEKGGYEGLVTGKKVFISYARGGDYSNEAAQSLDLQSKYLEQILGFMGLVNIQSIKIEPTLAGGPDVTKEKVESAIEKVKQIAENF